MSDLVKAEPKEIIVKSPQAPEETLLVATHPQELAAHHQTLMGTCVNQIATLQAELTEQQESLDLYKKRKWSTKGWARELAKTKKRITYYEKIHEALNMGYYMIPDFPCEVFAVRTKRKVPLDKTETWRDTAAKVSTQIMPQGEGKYVGPVAKLESFVDTETDHRGKKRDVEHHYPVAFQDPELFPGIPLKMVKARVLDATDVAMSAKLFDEIGVMVPTQIKTPGRPPSAAGKDPCIIGRIYDPTRSSTYSKFCVTFMVAWCLDAQDI